MEWINTKDKLPARGVKVLVFESECLGIASRPTDLDIKILNDTYEQEWPENTFDNADWHFPSKRVTHWMPLPPKPCVGVVENFAHEINENGN